MRSSQSQNESMSLSRVSAEEMDEKRQQHIAYEYLCHMEEAKKYINNKYIIRGDQIYFIYQ